MHRFADFRPVLRLCLCLPPDAAADDVRAALACGATSLWFRRGSLDGDAFHARFLFLRALCPASLPCLADAPAGSVPADGFVAESSQDASRSLSPAPARPLGIRVGSVTEALAAERAGADFLLAHSGASPDALHAMCASVDIPVVAGIDPDSAAAAFPVGSGAAGVCVRTLPRRKSVLDSLPGLARAVAETPPEPRRGALVDMDGTVLDSLDVWTDLDREIVERHRIPNAEEVLGFLNTVVHIREGTAYLHEKCGIGDSEEAVFQECRDILFDHYAHRIPLMPGAREALERLRAEGVRLALVTATEEELARAALRRNGVEPLFDHFYCNVSKRRPEALLQVLDSLGTGVRETMVYDDMDSVREMAESIGFQAKPGLSR